MDKGQRKAGAARLKNQDHRGKTVIITGANSGIGYGAALLMASGGACVIMACRNKEKAAVAAERIKKIKADAELHIMHLDLASLESVKHFSLQFREKHDKLDILINNAGVMATPFRKTSDGFERQFGVNHLGHFALTGRLIDILLSTAGSRVVTVTSIAHFKGHLHFDDLAGESWYRPMKAYRQSKLANLLFAYELQKRLSRMGATTLSVAAHPGLSSTNIVWLPFPLTLLKDLVLMSAARGSLPVLMAAAGEEIRGGEYIGPGGLRQSYGYPAVLSSSAESYDEDLWKKLWEVSEQMTGVRYLD